MKEIYPNKKRFFSDLICCLIVWILLIITSIVLQEIIIFIIYSCLLFAITIIFLLLPIKSYFIKIRFDEEGITRMFKQTVKAKISWREIQRIVFVGGRGHGVRLEKSSVYKENIGISFCNKETIEVLAEYIHKAINAEFIGTKTLSKKELKILNITKKD